MKIICVCGFGMGSSLILKISVEKAMKELGIPCDVEHYAAGTLGNAAYDLIVAGDDFAEEMSGRDDVILVKNVVKVEEIKASLETYFKNKNIL